MEGKARTIYRWEVDSEDIAVTDELIQPAEITDGIHDHLPASTYHQIDRVSSSGIRSYLANPVLSDWRYEQTHVKAENKEMRRGSMLHTALIEPNLYEDQYAVAPECDRRTKEGKALWGAFVAENIGKTISTAEDAEVVAAMETSVQALYDETAPSAAPHWRSLMKHARKELTIVGQLQGVPCKARLDLFNDLGVIVDLKTVGRSAEMRLGAGPHFVRWLIWRRRYHIQAAFYLMMARAAGLEAKNFIFIFVENAPPHNAAIYNVTSKWFGLAQEPIDCTLAALGEGYRTGKWPGITGAIQDLDPPEELTH